ncbi:MAG: hypothetical protein QXP59_03995 [Saccharolobus sp.]
MTGDSLSNFIKEVKERAKERAKEEIIENEYNAKQEIVDKIKEAALSGKNKKIKIRYDDDYNKIISNLEVLSDPRTSSGLTIKKLFHDKENYKTNYILELNKKHYLLTTKHEFYNTKEKNIIQLFNIIEIKPITENEMIDIFKNRY